MGRPPQDIPSDFNVKPPPLDFLWAASVWKLSHFVLLIIYDTFMKPIAQLLWSTETNTKKKTV